MASEIPDVEESALWSSQLEKSFIDVMVDEVNKGNMSSGIFTAKCWKQIREEFQKRTTHNYTVKQLKQKYNRLRIKHREFSTLLNEPTGFGWDSETNTVTADEESWQRYLRVHPYAKCFRRKGCENYRLLGVIFNRSTATGQLHYASTQDPPNTDEERELEEEFLNAGVHVNETSEGQDDSKNVIAEGSNRRRRRNSTPVERRGKKESKKDSMVDAISFFAEASKARTEVSKARTEAYEAKAERYKKMIPNQEATSSPPKNQHSLSRCIEILDSIDGINDETYLKAGEKFKEEHYRELFVNMAISRKLAWLNSL